MLKVSLAEVTQHDPRRGATSKHEVSMSWRPWKDVCPSPRCMSTGRCLCTRNSVGTVWVTTSLVGVGVVPRMVSDST